MTTPSPEQSSLVERLTVEQLLNAAISTMRPLTHQGEDRIWRAAEKAITIIETALERLPQPSDGVTEEEVKRVARAICGRDLAWRDCEGRCLAANRCVGTLADCLIEDARAAIAAMRSAATSSDRSE